MSQSPTLLCLDRGYVRLVDSMGSDLSIVRAARVSYDAEWRAGQDQGSDRKLIHYLMKNNHSTPFEAVTFTFEVKAPIFVIRQWHRHRTWSYNEISARYTELPNDYYIPEPQVVGKQSSISKQAREFHTEEELPLTSTWAVETIRAHSAQAFETYRSLLKQGIPRELARSVLPMSTYTRMFATVNLHNLYRFLKLRLDPHAQYEIRVYAERLLTFASMVAPQATEAFEEHQLEKKGK